MTTPANIITGLLMYANSNYYYSLDCCNPEGSHTSVYVTSAAQTIWSCDDPDRQTVDVGGAIEEGLVAPGEAPNYEFAGYDLSSASVLRAAKSAPGLVLKSLGKIAFDSVPAELTHKKFGLYSIGYNNRTYVFAVYEGAASGAETVVRPVSPIANAQLLYVIPISWDGATVRVRLIAHD